MKGNPLLRFLMLLIALAGMGLVVLKLTSSPAPSESEPISNSSAAETPSTTSYVLHFGSPILPALIHVESEGQVIGKITPDAESSDSMQMDVNLPAAGVDLVIRAEWLQKQNPLNALRMKVEKDHSMVSDVTFWGEPDILDVFTIPEEARQ